MAAPNYRAPGVSVTQEFEEPTPIPANTALIPNVLAPSWQIFEEEVVADGTYDSETDTATGYVYDTNATQDFSVPFDSGALVDTRDADTHSVDTDQFRVFLRGDTGTYEVEDDHWDYDPNNNGTTIVRIDGADDISSTLGETLNGSGSTNSDLDTNPADVLVTARALRGHIRSSTNQNDYWIEISTIDQLEEELGLIHPDNPLAWGMFWQLSSTDTVVTGQLVSHTITQDEIDASGGELLDHKTEAEFDDLLDIQQWEEALQRLESKEVYSMVPQYPPSDIFFDSSVMPSNVISSMVTHCELMSQPENKNERITTVVNPNFDQSLSDKNAIADDLFEFADSYNTRRLTLIVPPEAEVTVSGDVETVHANILAHSIAGMDASLSPSAPFTNRPMPVSVNRLFGSNDFFRDELLDEIAAGGNYIIEHDADGSSPYSRHQQTTNTEFIEKNERSIIKAVDYSAKLIRLQLEDFIGSKNITEDLLATMRTATQGAIGRLEEDDIIRNGEILDIRQHPDFDDETIIDVDITVLYPNNNINVTLFV